MDLKEMPLFIWFPGYRDLRHLRSGQYRERLIPLRRAAVEDSKQDCNSNSQGECEGDEIPQGWKSQHKDQRTAESEKQSDKSASEGEFVHGNAGMAFFGHGSPRFTAIIPLINSGFNEFSAAPGDPVQFNEALQHFLSRP
jgi:hypothetical protein